MLEKRFNADDVAELRRRMARGTIANPDNIVSGAAADQGALVQLNVRVRGDLKRRIELLALRRNASFAAVIDSAIELLERSR